MSKSSLTDVQRFQGELKRYRVIISENKQRLENHPLLAKQIDFWVESSRFLLTELEIWDRLGNRNKYNVTYNNARKAIDYLYTLIDQLPEDD